MSALLEIWPIIAAVFGALLWGFHQRSAGATAERAKQVERDNAAMADRLEMNREATEIERKASSMSDDEARKEPLRWSKR